MRGDTIMGEAKGIERFGRFRVHLCDRFVHRFAADRQTRRRQIDSVEAA